MFAILMMFQMIASPVFATSIDSKGYLGSIGSGLPGADATTGDAALTGIINSVITTILSVLGILLLAIIIFSGFEYMTSGGENEKNESAINRIKNATIGLLLIMASYAIARFVIDAIETATSGTAS